MSASILIVDDSLPMRGVLKKTIRAAGFGGADVLEAENGQVALNLLAARGADLVITDFNMPVMNGLDLLKAIREKASTGQPP